jgi:O-antigen/teichoic acid export membrane protein
MIRKLFSSQLRINMLSGVAAAIVNGIVLAVAYPLYLHFLGYETYGVWLILATVLTFAQLGNLGISPAVMKLVAEEQGRGNTKAIQNYVTTAFGILLITGGLALIIILLFQNQIISAFKLSGQNALIVSQFLPYIAFLSVCVMLVQVLNSTISGLGRMDIANYLLFGGRVITVSTSLILLWFGMSVESLLIGNTLSYIFVGIASLLFIRKAVEIHLFRISNLDSQCFSKLLRFGGGVFGGSLISMFLHPFNKLILSRYAGISSIPIYEIAFNGSMQIRGLFEAGLRSLMPEISRIGANMTKYGRDRISKIHHRAKRFIFLFGLPVYGSLFTFSAFLFRIWLGKGFTEALPGVFRILLIATFLSLICVPAYYTLLGLGRVRACFSAHAIQAGGNVVVVLLVIMLTPTFHVVHIAWAVLIGMGMTCIYVLYEKRRMLSTITE